MSNWMSTDDQLPDDDRTVQIALACEVEVFAGFFNDGEWFDSTGLPLQESVTHWAEMARHPADCTEQATEVDRLRAELATERAAREYAEAQHAHKHAEVERLRAELERERVRLAACGVIALANTPQSAARVRDMAPAYRSASCDDVADAVDREIALRAELEREREKVERLREALRHAADEPSIDRARAIADAALSGGEG